MTIIIQTADNAEIPVSRAACRTDFFGDRRRVSNSCSSLAGLVDDRGLPERCLYTS
jgi:hypothetical protein